MEELKHLLNFYDAKAEDKDYSVLNTLNSDFLTKGNCIYCNHCQPCSEGIDIGIMNKYYDLYVLMLFLEFSKKLIFHLILYIKEMYILCNNIRNIRKATKYLYT